MFKLTIFPLPCGGGGGGGGPPMMNVNSASLKGHGSNQSPAANSQSIQS